MYLEHYKLKLKPFQITADPRFLWLGEKHKEALATLRYGIVDNRGFLLLTGEVGTGKTVLINRLITLLDIDTVVATLTDPDLNSLDFYNLLADGLKMGRTFDSKGAFLIHLRDFLHQSYSRQQQVLLIIDESQRLNHHLIEDIRVLSNIELHDRKLINIFFVGQQEFNSILMTPQNRALAQRITVRYHIEPLDENETREYIEHRLKVAGTTRQIFNRAALKEIYQFSGGIPRLINIMCDHALLTGYSRGAKQINDVFVKECAEDLRIPVKRPVGHQEPAGNASKVSAIRHVDDDVQDNPPPSQPAVDNYLQQNEDAAQGNSVQNKDIRNNPAQKNPAWKFAYAAIVLILIGVVAFSITHFTSMDRPRWDTEDLTPQKYKETLEKEKEILSSQLKQSKKQPVEDNVVEAERSSPTNMEPLAKDMRQPGNKPENKTDTAAADGAQPIDGGAGPAGNDLKPAPVGNETGEIEPLPLIEEDLIIYFDINSNEIDAQSFPMLDRIAHYLTRHPNEVVHVRGYTDASGSTGYNKSVSLFRANNVKSYLLAKGVPSDNVVIFAMGAQNPIASNDSFEGRRKNRRVEIEFPQESSESGN